MPDSKPYPKDTAGYSIDTEIPVFLRNETIQAATHKILKDIKKYKTINYIYLVDRDYKLCGVVSIKNLFDAEKENKEAHLETLAKDQSLITVHPYSHQERAAILAVRHNIKAIPVVDREGKLVGIIDNDKILSIMHQEKVEDLLKFAGISKYGANLDNFLQISLFTSLKHRLPWLIVGLVGGLCIAQLIAFFEESLEQTVVIAAFIPMMVYMSNAVGQQVTALLIRDSALNEKIPYLKYFLKQFASIVVIGLIVSMMLFASILFIHQDTQIAVALALAMFGTVSSSIVTGFLIPFVFIKLKSDPANSSGPVGTVIQDFFSVLIYFCIISIIL